MHDYADIVCGVEAIERRVHVSMNEDEFLEFYALTARRLRAYLTRMSGDASLSDDLMQEAYCRWFEAAGRPQDGDGQRRYLFRIATNLFYDHCRQAKRNAGPIDQTTEPVDEEAERRFEIHCDVGDVFRTLKPRQRALLWLAYVEGMRHAEIAQVLGLSRLSIRPLLLRARRQMAKTLRARNLEPRRRS
jgi:RNA polymerase sigma-70 factor (ECF subfamily)